jgi:Rho GDP-dissociation inhibitor
MSEKEQIEQDEANTPVDNFKPPPKESIDELLSKDADDESLRKYKEQLLGAAAKGVPKTDDPRLVVIQSFGLRFPNGEHADIIHELDTKQKEEDLKKTPITVKEGVDYQFVVTFRVQHDIVSALKFSNSVYKASIRIEKKDHMMGSYAPAENPYTWKSPTFTAPSGMLARGQYKANTKFIDDYKKTHLELDYTLTIGKDF